MSGQRRRGLPKNPLHAELPRIMVLLGIAFMVLGALAIIGFVAGDTSCNAATTLSPVGGSSSTGFCGHEQGFLTGSFVILVVGGLLVAAGSMVLPILRERDARQAAAEHTSDDVDVDNQTSQP